MHKNKKLLTLVAPIVVVAALFAGCGSSSDDSSSDTSSSSTSTATDNSSTTAPAGQSSKPIALAADPGGALAYTQTSLTGKSGNVTIDFTNDSPIGHDVAIDDASGKQLAESDVITGGSTSVNFTAKPGKYTYFCTLPGHEEAGMKGTLTIK